MRAGELRFLVEVKNPTRVPEGGGRFTETWNSVGKVWANIEELSSQERWMNFQTGSISTHKVTMRFTDLVSNESRLYHEARTFHVVSVVNVGNMNRELQITVEERK